MLAPEHDLADRKPVWDFMQEFWMDTDPNLQFGPIVDVCARSKYSVAELEQIYWNEVHPAIKFNLIGIAPDWAGYELDWLTARILEKIDSAGDCPF